MNYCSSNIKHIVIGCGSTQTDSLPNGRMIAIVMIDESAYPLSTEHVPDFYELPVIRHSDVYLEKDELIFHDYVNKFEHVFEHVFNSFSEHGRIRIRSPG